MSSYIKNIRCPVCNAGHGVGVYYDDERGYNGTCFKCNSYFHNLNEDDFEYVDNKPKEINLESLNKSTTITNIEHRGISKEVCERYGVRSSVNEITGEVDKTYFPRYSNGNLVGYKVKDRHKGMSTIGDGKGAQMFGQNICGESGQLLIITEGEEDCLAAYQIIKNQGKNYRVCSLPDGASTRAIKNNLEWLDKFDTLLLAFDQDEPGQKCALETADLFKPGKVKIMKFSEKDANDMLLSGKEREFYQAIYNAREYRPDGIVSVDDVYDKVMKPVEVGLPWPWETLTTYTFGRRRRELIGIGAAQGNGKSEFCKELIHSITENDKLPVGGFFLEEPVEITIKQVAGKLKNKRFHVPDGNWTYEELSDALDHLRGKLYLYNHEGCNNDWESIKSKIRFFVNGLGIKDIIVDHLTAIVAHEQDEYRALNRIMQELSSLTHELDCTIYFISHLATAPGTPHEEGGRVMASQFRGSRAIAFWSNFLFGLERDQQAEDVVERNTTTLRILKDRYTGASTGNTFKLLYNNKTGEWVEYNEDLANSIRKTYNNQIANTSDFDEL